MIEDTRATAKELFCKTRLCKFHAKGRCKQGERCLFAHGNAKLAPLPDFSHTRMCPSFLDTGTCRHGDRCSFAHSEQDLRPSVSKATSNAAIFAPLPSSNKSKIQQQGYDETRENPPRFAPCVQQDSMNSMSTSFADIDACKVVSEDTWGQETDVGDDDLESLGATTRQTTEEVGEDIPVIDTFTKVPTHSSSWMVHLGTGLEFRLEHTFLKFNQGRVVISERSASSGR